VWRFATAEREGAPRDTLGAEAGCDEKVCRSGKKRAMRRQGGEVRAAPRHVKNTNWREWFHAAAVTTGGERSWISAAVSRSMIFIGPAHLGQRQSSDESWAIESWVSVHCCEPNRASER
jgi:hypothetical protein